MNNKTLLYVVGAIAIVAVYKWWKASSDIAALNKKYGVTT